ncbi:MAG: DUF4856 domain-containing protein [Bacteroidetes bacterium]|nr:DUF4856 domain-containing protein [Bacteroidota bacterium]
MANLTTKNSMKLSATGVLSLALVFTACKKDPKIDVDGIDYTVPTTYNFSNVKHEDESTLILMFTELETEMKKAVSSSVSSAKLQDMFANVNDQFVSGYLDSAAVDIKSNTLLASRIQVESYMDSLALMSASNGNVAANGVAGIGVSTVDVSKKYLLSAKGINYQQMVSKTLMSTFVAYQITQLVSSSADNTTVIAGQGTAMEHDWDRAFGIFYAPIDFPSNLSGLKFWSNYCNQVNTIGSNKVVMDAFLKGRAAISNGDIATKNAQAAIIIEEFEKMTAAAVIHELKDVKADFANTPVVNTKVSEAIAFLQSMKYNNSKKYITNAKVDEIIAMFGDNLYELTTDKVNKVVNAISALYGWDSIKDSI